MIYNAVHYDQNLFTTAFYIISSFLISSHLGNMQHKFSSHMHTSLLMIQTKILSPWKRLKEERWKKKTATLKPLANNINIYRDNQFWQTLQEVIMSLWFKRIMFKKANMQLHGPTNIQVCYNMVHIWGKKHTRHIIYFQFIWT